MFNLGFYLINVCVDIVVVYYLQILMLKPYLLHSFVFSTEEVRTALKYMLPFIYINVRPFSASKCSCCTRICLYFLFHL